MLNLPQVSTKLLEQMSVDETKLFEDMKYNRVSCYIVRAGKTGMKFAQQRALLVTTIDETMPVMLITRTA